jgi:uncharacterized protein (DUF1778 family)
MADATRRRDKRIEVRATQSERDLILRAVEETGGDLTSFALASLITTSQKVLADRTEFSLDSEAVKSWERINTSPARRLPGLMAFLERESPFSEN